MDITLYISRFLYRIRYQLIFGTLIITALTAYFSQFMGKSYTVTTSIYTGITSATGLDTESQPDWQAINNTFDNLVNLTKSRGTLESVSLKLLAQHLLYGNPQEDNTYITARNYKNLKNIVPEDILALVDTTSFEKTVSQLDEYRLSDSHNFIQGLFNGSNPFYGIEALSQIVVRRVGNSDLIEISYRSEDPGIALNTVKLISDELKFSYSKLRYKTADDIVKYYEDELKKLQLRLKNLEDELTDYNIENSVINYEEQTKAISGSFAEFENRYEETLRNYESSTKLLQGLEQYMKIRVQLIKSNEKFLEKLEEISKISGKITEIESFTSEDVQTKDSELQKYRDELRNAEKDVALITEQINGYKESKEGVAIDGLVAEWLSQTLIQIKAQAELKILDQRKEQFAEQYRNYSPIGTKISQQEREIHVVEQSYLEVLHALNMAKMKQKNLQLTSASLNTISEPSYPLFSDKGRRMLLIIAAFIGSIIFIIGLNLLIELLDRTLRDSERAKRLTGMDMLGAFTGNTQLKFRGFIKACNRISAAYVCKRMNRYMTKDKALYVNIFSIEEKEGKSFICKYLCEQWEEMGFKVQYVQIEKDVFVTSSFITADQIEDETRIDKDAKIILVEYPSLQKHGLPASLLGKSDINLLVANASRVWKLSDSEYANYLNEMVKGSPLFLYLNNASRQAVEDFTGQLPPETSMRSLSNRMMYMGLTSTNSAVKK